MSGIPTPSVQTTNDRIFEGIIGRFSDDADTLELQALEINNALESIQAQLLGKNNNTSIALARSEIVKRSNQRTQLDLTTYKFDRAAIVEFSRNADIITRNTSYTLDVLLKVVAALKDSNIIDRIQLQNLSGQGNQMVVEKAQEGIFGRLKNFFSGFRSQQQQDFERAILLLEGKLREIQGARERWISWKMNHIKYMEMAVLYSERGEDIDHMFGFFLTDVRTFNDMKERLLPTLASGLRYNNADYQKTFASIAGSMAQTATAEQQRQAMMMNMGMMPTQRASVMPVSNNPQPNSYETSQ